MDDFSLSTLYESKNEWASRLITILTPFIVEGYTSILKESIEICNSSNEPEKYLLTFQNYISRIPKWNNVMVEIERQRICDRSECPYLEDLLTCVHVVHLKILTATRAGQKQKKIDIDIPSLDDFLHKVYINTARKIYKNVYLFERGIAPLLIQKNNREVEMIVQECILNTVRENIPVEAILRAYLDSSTEEEKTDDITEEIIYEDVTPNIEDVEVDIPTNIPENIPENSPTNIRDDNGGSKIQFEDTSYNDSELNTTLEDTSSISRIDDSDKGDTDSMHIIEESPDDISFGDSSEFVSIDFNEIKEL
jgi:hypothetical protein